MQTCAFYFSVSISKIICERDDMIASVLFILFIIKPTWLYKTFVDIIGYNWHAYDSVVKLDNYYNVFKMQINIWKLAIFKSRCACSVDKSFSMFCCFADEAWILPARYTCMNDSGIFSDSYSRQIWRYRMLAKTWIAEVFFIDMLHCFC